MVFLVYVIVWANVTVRSSGLSAETLISAFPSLISSDADMRDFLHRFILLGPFLARQLASICHLGRFEVIYIFIENLLRIFMSDFFL